MTIELTDDGITIGTLDDIKDLVAAAMRLKISSDIDTTPDSVAGQLISIIAEQAYQIEQKVRDVDQSRTASGASGQALTNLALLSPGTVRRLATYSTVGATLNLDDGVTVPAGSEVRVPGQSVLFVTQEDVTNSSGITANFVVATKASQAGPVRANTGTLTEIVTTGITGWNSVTNAEDAILGLADETDAELRVRRIVEQRSSGASNIDAIKAGILAVDGVIDARVISDDVGHTTNSIVWDGDTPLADDVELAQAIWGKAEAGIPTIGAESALATDVDGNTHTVRWDRATAVPIYCNIYIFTDATYPDDGDEQVVQRVVDFANSTYGISDDVIVSQLYPIVIGENGVQGVLDIDLIAVAEGSMPFTATGNVLIGTTEISRFDTARTAVNGVVP